MIDAKQNGRILLHILAMAVMVVRSLIRSNGITAGIQQG
jgi:hypothetical protein